MSALRGGALIAAAGINQALLDKARFAKCSALQCARAVQCLALPTGQAEFGAGGCQLAVQQRMWAVSGASRSDE